MIKLLPILIALLLALPSVEGEESVNLELTDQVLPRIEEHVATHFYQMLKDVNELLEKRGIAYWLTCGTLLGALRHQGMIPWDDDMDLAFFENDIAKLISLRPELKKRGYELLVLRDYIKIFPAEGKLIAKAKGENYPWKYPFIDLFPMKKYEGRVSYASERLYEAFGKTDWFHEADTASLSPAAFGSLSAPIPGHAREYLERLYGEDVWEVAYATYRHAEEKQLQKIKVRLVTKSPAPELSAK
jgi:lipopolysaccharide cholinephosphotransferase